LRALTAAPHARDPHPARAGGALANGAGPVEPGDRGCAVRLRRQRREAHLLTADQARPAARGRGEPARHGGAALSGVGGADVTAPVSAPAPAPTERPAPRYDPPRRLEPSPER